MLSIKRIFQSRFHFLSCFDEAEILALLSPPVIPGKAGTQAWSEVRYWLVAGAG